MQDHMSTKGVLNTLMDVLTHHGKRLYELVALHGKETKSIG